MKVFLLTLSLWSSLSAFAGSPDDLASKLFNQLACGSWKTGDADPRIEMAALIKQGKFKEAAAKATAASGFINCNLRRFFSAWSNRAKDPFGYLNDMTASLIGHVRDDLPFNQVLYDNVYYYFDSSQMTSLFLGKNFFDIDCLKVEPEDAFYPRILQKHSLLLGR